MGSALCALAPGNRVADAVDMATVARKFLREKFIGFSLANDMVEVP
jgi:hypothetical protein